MNEAPIQTHLPDRGQAALAGAAVAGCAVVTEKHLGRGFGIGRETLIRHDFLDRHAGNLLLELGSQRFDLVHTFLQDPCQRRRGCRVSVLDHGLRSRIKSIESRFVVPEFNGNLVFVIQVQNNVGLVSGNQIPR